MTVRPRVLGQRVLVKPLEAAEATASGLVLPREVQEKETRGIVVALAEEEFAPVDVGDIVVWAEQGSSPLTRPTRICIDDQETGNCDEFWVVAYDDLLVVLEDETAAERIR